MKTLNLEGNFKVLSKLVDLKAETKTKLIDDEMKYEMKSHEMQYKMKRTRKIYISVDLVVFFWGGNKTHTEETLSVEPFQANCNLRDCHGMTPLMEAAAANYAEAWDVGPLGNPGVAGVQNTNGPRLWRRCWVKNLPSLVRRPWVG